MSNTVELSMLHLIKELRAKTGMGLLECRKAIEATGNINAAIDFLRKEGHSVSWDHRDPRIGRVHSYVHHNGRCGALVAFICETDFAANSVEFNAFMNDVCIHAAAIRRPVDHPLEEFLLEPFVRDTFKTIKNLVVDIEAKIGEKVEIVKVQQYQFG